MSAVAGNKQYLTFVRSYGLKVLRANVHLGVAGVFIWSPDSGNSDARILRKI